MAAPRLLLSVLVAVAGGTALPAAASAALPWQPCTPTGFQCASLDVPLDRSGATPGVVTLGAKRVAAAANPGGVAVVALAGGPGQAATPLAATFASDLAAAIPTRDLLVYDQRGTGTSNLLGCPALRVPTTTTPTQSRIDQATKSCSEQIGPARGFFRTADSVQDIEALRVAGGYTKLVLYGVSYGTKVAEAYASAYPANVESLVLDSVVTPEGPDAFRRGSLAAVPRVTDEICANGLCKGITTSASRDLAALATKLRKKSISGSVYSPRGGRFTARLTEGGLFGILLAGDLNPAVRAELPGSLRAALGGDVKPILRLSARSAGLSNRAGYQSSAADSDALFLATTCEENLTFPWVRGAATAEKITQGKAAAAALPDGSTAPFSRTAAYDQSILPTCQGWTTASPAPVADGPLPAVPTLVIDGRADLRTPLEDATNLAGRIPGAQLLPVPNVGHSVLGSDPTACAKNAVAAFFAGGVVAQCAPAAPRFAPTPKPPTRASRLKPYGKLKGKVGRTVEALRSTVNDAQSQILGEAIALGATPRGAGALRSGYVSVSGSTLRLRRYEYVPGVFVTGSLLAKGTSTFTISGKQASRGKVRVTQGLAVSGTLDGKRVSTRFGRSAAVSASPFGGLTLAQAVARGKKIRAAVG